MRFWMIVLTFFEGDKLAAAVAISALFLTVLSVAAGFCMKSAGLYAALSLLIVSACGVFYLLWGIEERRLAFCLAIEGALLGMGYACLYIKEAVAKKIAERREKREERKRRLQFILPDRENGYLRDRLHVALNTEKEDVYSERWKIGARLGYARKMLAKIKEAPLSPLERIDVEEMARLVALYERKGKWSSSDVKAVGEILSRLLKLSAKYDIAV